VNTIYGIVPATASSPSTNCACAEDSDKLMKEG